MIKNLDTGEEIPLSLAEEKLPTGINPLTLHIMRRTKEYVRYESQELSAYKMLLLSQFCINRNCSYAGKKSPNPSV